MHVPTHALLGWLLAESVPDLERRDRLLIAAAGVVPDIDGLVILGGAEAFRTWHHILLHNGLTAVVYACVAAAFARRRAAVGLLALAGVHLHLLCDYVGSAGPDGSTWSIPYLRPFDPTDFYCSFQWGLASWQNVSITLVAVLACGALGVRRGRTILEAVSLRADGAVVETLRRRFGGRHADVPIT